MPSSERVSESVDASRSLTGTSRVRVTLTVTMKRSKEKKKRTLRGGGFEREGARTKEALERC